MLLDIYRLLLRRKTPIQFQDWRRREPIDKNFGFFRGSPIDRYYIEKFLSANAAQIAGTVLETESAIYTRKFPENVKKVEILHLLPGNPEATLVADLTKIGTLPANAVDCFLCTQTLNFIFDVPLAVAGMAHLVKPDGVALITVAGMCQVSRYDELRWGDYYRFSQRSLQKHLEASFETVEMKTYGNVLAAIALLQGIAVEDLPEPRLLDEVDGDYPLVVTAVARKPKKSR